MALKVLRWFGMVAGMCAAIAVATLPFPAARDEQVESPEMTRLRTEYARTRTVAGELESALARYRASRAVSRWTAFAHRDTLPVHLDRSLPSSLQPALDSVARSAWSGLGSSARASRATVFLFIDTSAIALRRRAGYRRATEVTYVLPDPPAATECAALVRAGASLPDAAKVYGPCGFYAAFGEPGTAIRRWLERTDYGFARGSEWSKTSTASTESPYDLSAGLAGCLTRGDAACLTLLAVDSTSASAGVSRVETGQTPRVLGPFTANAEMWGNRLGRRERQFLADMVREFGATRFRAFWTSGKTPEGAFADAIGRSLADWTREWIARSVAPPARAATLSSNAIVWLAIAVPLLMVAGALRREAVITGARAPA